MADKLALYFGSLGHGHFLHHPHTDRVALDPDKLAPGIPWSIELMDSGLLKNGRVPDRPTGKVHWTLGGRPTLWYAFYWWDRSKDTRPGSNSGFYVRGFDLHQAEQAFEYACSVWPEVVHRQAHNLRLMP